MCVASPSCSTRARRRHRSLAVLLHSYTSSSSQSRPPPAIVAEPPLPEVRRSSPPDPATQVSSPADPVARRELSPPSSSISSPPCQAQTLSLAPLHVRNEVKEEVVAQADMAEPSIEFCPCCYGCMQDSVDVLTVKDGCNSARFKWDPYEG
uniref:Uncharacterized protein n=1 Tax=Oryza rufipogon TaxID=4529 RepID=A0A0E0NVE3_ORYRU